MDKKHSYSGGYLGPTYWHDKWFKLPTTVSASSPEVVSTGIPELTVGKMSPESVAADMKKWLSSYAAATKKNKPGEPMREVLDE